MQDKKKNERGREWGLRKREREEETGRNEKKKGGQCSLREHGRRKHTKEGVDKWSTGN